MVHIGLIILYNAGGRVCSDSDHEGEALRSECHIWSFKRAEDPSNEKKCADRWPNSISMEPEMQRLRPSQIGSQAPRAAGHSFFWTRSARSHSCTIFILCGNGITRTEGNTKDKNQWHRAKNLSQYFDHQNLNWIESPDPHLQTPSSKMITGEAVKTVFL